MVYTSFGEKFCFSGRAAKIGEKNELKKIIHLKNTNFGPCLLA